MAKEHSEAMMATKVVLKKLRKRPSLKFGQKEQWRELGLAIDAVPCGGVGEILFKKLIQQRKEILQLLNSAGYAIEEIAGNKKRKTLSLHIEDLDMEGDERSNPKGIRASSNDAHVVLSVRELRRAASFSQKAIDAISQGHLDRSIEYYVCAERRLGAGLALAQVGKITSTIASVKGKSRHRETQALRAKTIDYWHKECEPTLSAEKAAEDLVGRIHWKNGNFVSHRTIAEWISEEKKKCASLK